VLPLLADFGLVVPSIPGYGFSDRPWEEPRLLADDLRAFFAPSG
jgi:hypothetical protein